MSGKLPIFYETKQVGAITVTGDGAEFSCDPKWTDRRGAFPLSISMPFGADAGPEQLEERIILSV